MMMMMMMKVTNLKMHELLNSLEEQLDIIPTTSIALTKLEIELSNKINLWWNEEWFVIWLHLARNPGIIYKHLPLLKRECTFTS